MRKILGNPALEAELAAVQAARAAEEQEAAHRVALESISLEEEAAMSDEAYQCADQAKNDLAEADRVIEVSDALEDLAVIAGDIKEPTEGEVALMGNAAQMAVAGTDIAPSEVVPALESLEDFKKSAGDFSANVKAKAKAIWEKIMGFLKKIWAQIQEFFYRILDTVPRLQKKITEQLKELGGLSGKTLSGNRVKMNVGAVSLSLNGGSPATPEELVSGFTGLSEACDWVYGAYAKSIKARGEAVAKEIEGFSWDAPRACAEAVIHAIATGHPLPEVPGAIPGHGNIAGYTVSLSKPVMGGISLQRKAADRAQLSSDNPLSALDALRKEAITVERAAGGELGRAWETMPLDTHRASSLLKDAQGILKHLEAWKKTGLKDLEHTRGKLEHASNKASSSSKANKDLVPKDIDVALYRGALNFNTAFANWTTQPAVDLLRSALASVRALVVLVDKSIASYGAPALSTSAAA